ncbi:MAG: hypothetical protein PVI57_18035, partial [Gemmatimonadota bacterium]
ASPRRILAAVFARAGAQVGGGIVAGLALSAVLERAFGHGEVERGFGVPVAVVALMMAVGLLATLGPARRGLSVQPTEALKGE